MKHQHNSYLIFLLIVVLLLVNACVEPQIEKKFELLSATHTHIDFSNNITTADTFNVLNFHYIYNGGGVGVGDFDKNGLPDLIFTGNQVTSKLYLNQGNLQFKDVTEIAGTTTTRWATGVSVADINADGWEDIYISVGGLDCQGDCFNYLFIHQGLNENGIPTFVEKAAEYGLEDGLYTQQAAFFDYDSDGDLDVYLLRNAITTKDKNTPTPKRFISKNSKDQFLRNEFNNNNTGNITPKFVDVSEELNITRHGYGLGIAINDFNLDGRPDIYIANDFLSEDLLYLNTLENGFQEASKQYLKHTSYNAMGVDAADINGDALPDIVVLDMLPETQERKKSMQGFMNYNKFALSLRQDYMPQFIRNTLQIHNGLLDDELLSFSEMGYIAGVYNTDWSWSPLLADLDNDGDRDLYVTNGYGKDITDLDFINYSQSLSQFGTKAARQQQLFEQIEQMKDVDIPNYIFENQGHLQFKNQSAEWMMPVNSISNGAVYTDLDNDGDLDLVANNINQAAFILKNNTTGNNYLKIKLEGKGQNTNGIGATVEIWANGQHQKHYHSPVRGYLSSVESLVHFGLGTSEKIDSLRIILNGKGIVKTNVSANQTYVVNLDGLDSSLDMPNLKDLAYLNSSDQLFHSDSTTELNILHQENPFQDFDRQPLLLKQLSRQGPSFAVANVDGKPGDELFIGGAKGVVGKIYYPQKDGTYRTQSLPDSLNEDTDAAFLDINGDKALDLYVVSGGTEYLADSPEYQDRIYLNDGQGNFTKRNELQSPVSSSGSCVRPCDFDGDGDMDLFVGGRIVPGKFPATPRSFLWINHQGRLINHTDKLAYGLQDVGMVSDAIWSDYDGDDDLDLIVVGEWMRPQFFNNVQGHFKKDRPNFEATQDMPNLQDLAYLSGLWNSISAGDFDQDGDEDYLLGNLGENTLLHASIEEPLLLYKGDFDDNGSPDPLIGHFYTNQKGERHNFPLHARDDVMRQLVKVKNRFRTYAEFGQASFQEIIPTSEEDFLEVNCLSSVYLENMADGTFMVHLLPKAAQIAPIQDILVADFNRDGHLDALLSGNDYTAESSGGWQDAFNGLFLQGDGRGNFQATATAASGFYVPGDGRDMALMEDGQGEEMVVVGQNSGRMKVFRYGETER